VQQRNQGLDRHTGFEPSEGRTEAEVDFEAEAEMRARIAMKIEVIEILELAFISIGETGHDHEVAALRNSRISDQARSRQEVQAAFLQVPILEVLSIRNPIRALLLFAYWGESGVAVWRRSPSITSSTAARSAASGCTCR